MICCHSAHLDLLCCCSSVMLMQVFHIMNHECFVSHITFLTHDHHCDLLLTFRNKDCLAQSLISLITLMFHFILIILWESKMIFFHTYLLSQWLTVMTINCSLSFFFSSHLMIIQSSFSSKTAWENSWLFYFLFSCLCLITFLKQSVTIIILSEAFCYSSADLSCYLSSE